MEESQSAEALTSYEISPLALLGRNDRIVWLLRPARPERSRMGRNDKVGVVDSARMTRWLA